MPTRAAKPNGKASRREVYIDFENFALGLWSLQDTTKAPFGSARTMTNMQVTDRGGIAPRPGTVLLGTKNTTPSPTRGLYNFRKSFDQDQFLIKAYDDELEVYSLNHSAAGWWRLKNGFTADKEFGFVSSLVNNDSQDKCIFCNRYEPYQTWIGAVTLLDGALVGGETTIVVDSVLTEEVFYSGTATSNSATTIDVSTAPWAADQFVNMYVHILAGAESGKIRLITANTTSQITFDTLGGGPGNVAFEIRLNAFPATGTLIVGGNTLAYTAIPTATSFTTSAAVATADNAAVSLVPTEYKEAPRGNRLTNYLGRIVVGNVRSAIARGSGGARQGYASGGSYFVSKINTPTDFSYAATRVAGEGDIIGTPYGGGEITDVVAQEDTAYVLKPRYIESVKYSQDANDLAVREPLKAEVGAITPTIKGSDDVYFISNDNKLTSIGRTLAKDIKPQTTNMGFKIKRLLDSYTFDFGRGIEYKDLVFIPAKSDSSSSYNDLLVVYSKTTDSFWGIWDIPANFLEQFNNKLYYGDSVLPNIYEMFNGTSDVDGADRYAIGAQYATQFMNLTPSDGSLQAINGMYYEGYINGDTVITFKVWKDFENEPFLQFDFSGTETEFQSGEALTAFLGGTPISLRPHGALSVADTEGRRHFYFRIYFPFQYGYHFSLGLESSGTDFDYEVTRMGMLLKTTVTSDATKIKVISET